MNSHPLAHSAIHAISANWWILLLRGILLIAVGIYALLHPGISLLAWALTVGFFLILDGVLSLIAGIAGWTESRGWTILRGVLSLLIGAFAIWHPAVFGTLAGLTVIFMLAAWSIVGGIMEIIVAIRERKEIHGEGWIILSGVFSIIFGIVLCFAPLLSLAIFIRMSGLFAIIFGIMCIFTSLKLLSVKKRMDTRSA
jgi:uncharacterized membrane protein HdeD (DUF308 family)